jgi:tetrahydromethanopterin S-methyltransferase subunit F
MPTTVKHLIEAGYKEPMVIFPLKQYVSLMEYIEDIEDRLAVITRSNEPNVSQQEVEELFKKKFTP